MAKVIPFHGLLPSRDNVADVAAVPYDVVNSAEAAALAADNPLSFLRVSRPEIELPPGTEPHADAVYEKAAANFQRLCENAPLCLDTEAQLYIYELTMGKHTQTGVAGAVSAEEYKLDIIKKHEKTRRDKEDDRTRHLLATRSHTGPVFLTFKDDIHIDKLVIEVKNSPPLFNFTSDDKITHRFWRAGTELSAELKAAFENVPFLYIADGHHRAASAARTAAAGQQGNPEHTGNEDYNFFLAVAFPASQLQILPYNRVVFDLNGLNREELLNAVQVEFELSQASATMPAEPGKICMYLDGKWSLLIPKFKPEELGLIEQLDVSILQNHLLSPILGIDDPRTSSRIDFVGGIRGTKELEKRVDSGECAVAFSMFPTTVEQLMAIADAGAVMPPKSTWFEPKLRDGIVCHNF